MRKTVLFLMIVALLAAAPISAFAQRIGFVDIKQIVFQSEAGKKATAEFRSSFEKKKAAIQQKEAELKKEKQNVEQQQKAGILKDTALKQLEHDYQVKFREYQRYVTEANEELGRKDQELTSKLVPDVYKVIEKIGEKDGYSLILDVNNPVVVYHSKGGTNLTARVLAEFNKSYKNK